MGKYLCIQVPPTLQIRSLFKDFKVNAGISENHGCSESEYIPYIPTPTALKTKTPHCAQRLYKISMLFIIYCGGYGTLAITWNYHRNHARIYVADFLGWNAGISRAIDLLTTYVHKIVPLW